jgi:hypothetical protein
MKLIDPDYADVEIIPRTPKRYGTYDQAQISNSTATVKHQGVKITIDFKDGWIWVTERAI